MNSRNFFTLLILFILSSNNCLARENKFSSAPLKKTYKIEFLLPKVDIPSDIAFYDADENKHFLEEFEGKPILLVFWATWCAPCVQEIVDLDLLSKDFRKLNIQIIAVSQDYQGASIVKEFYERNEIKHLQIYYDFKNQLFKAFDIVGLPTTFIINEEGKIESIISGAINWNDEDVREMLLRFIPGNNNLPKNSHKESFVNSLEKKPKPVDDSKK